MKKLRYRSKSKYFVYKADKAMQDCYRALHLKCEVCGLPANLMHHFIEKSKSNNLRFEEENLIPLCRMCHFKHHNMGDSIIKTTIIKKRGLEWLDRITKKAREVKQFTKAELDQIAKIYKKKYEDLLKQKVGENKLKQ